MPKQRKITDQIGAFESLSERKDLSLDSRLDELIKLLDKSELDTESIKRMQSKIDEALQKKLSQRDLISEIKDVSMADADKLDQLNQLEVLLNNNYLSSKQTKKIKFKDTALKIIQVALGFLLVTLGFSMIILPAPPYFEMFTIFHFTYDDGFTLMDLISLIIILFGIYVVVKSYFKFSS